MRRAHLLGILILLATLLAGSPARAQDRSIEGFVQQVAQLWHAGNESAIVRLAHDGRISLDTGSGTETVNTRHAAAALRALFGERESIGARTVRVTLAGGSPPRGFGELTWTFRSRSAPVPQSRSLYVGAIQDGGAWRITELRVMP